MVLLFVLLSLLLPVMAQETPLDPEIGAVVTEFYDGYIDTLFSSSDRGTAYQESPYLTADFIANLDAQFAQEERMADPLLCAQAVPSFYSVEVVRALSQEARVLMRQHFDSPLTHNIMIDLIQTDDTWKINGVRCEDTVTPRGVTQAFYDFWLGYVGYDVETGHFENPMVNRIWRSSDLLTVELIDRLDAMMDSDTPIGHDPVLCAQDVPRAAQALEIDVRDDQARVLVNEFFGDFPVPHRVLVTLQNTADGWKINDIPCTVTPETVALSFYRLYNDFTRYDMDYGIERTRLVDWGFNWNAYLSEALLAELRATFTDPAGLPADPVLCAQDIPDFVELTPIEASDESASLQLRGMYPSGEDTVTGYDLATINMEKAMGRWVIGDILCGATTE
jgi:hypothetical protein